MTRENGNPALASEIYGKAFSSESNPHHRLRNSSWDKKAPRLELSKSKWRKEKKLYQFMVISKNKVLKLPPPFFFFGLLGSTVPLPVSMTRQYNMSSAIHFLHWNEAALGTEIVKRDKIEREKWYNKAGRDQRRRISNSILYPTNDKSRKGYQKRPGRIRERVLAEWVVAFPFFLSFSCFL